MSVLSRPYFHDEEKSFEYLESVVWADGKVCPHCGGVDRITKVKANPAKRIRRGLWRCGDCKKQFTVKVGTVFEHARIPLNKALQATYLMTSSKKGISAHQLHRVLEVTYKTAWFLTHRLREAMRSGDLAPFGGNGGIVEADVTFIGVEPGHKNFSKARGGFQHKMKVLALVDGETGRSRARRLRESPASAPPTAGLTKPPKKERFTKKGGDAIRTAASLMDPFLLAHIEAADPGRGLAASLI